MNHKEVSLISMPSAHYTVGLRSKIGELREKRKMTQRELSDQVGVTETTIANWEKGRRGLEWFDRLIRLCKALKCKPEDLIEYFSTPFNDENEDPIKQGGMSFSEMVAMLETDQSSDSKESKKEGRTSLLNE